MTQPNLLFGARASAKRRWYKPNMKPEFPPIRDERPVDNGLSFFVRIHSVSEGVKDTTPNTFWWSLDRRDAIRAKSKTERRDVRMIEIFRIDDGRAVLLSTTKLQSNKW